MARTRPYPPKYRQQIIELARAGRSAYELAQEFEPSYWTIHQWIKQADRDEGHTAVVGMRLREQARADPRVHRAAPRGG